MRSNYLKDSWRRSEEESKGHVCSVRWMPQVDRRAVEVIYTREESPICKLGSENGRG